MADIRDIMDINKPSTSEAFLNADKFKTKKNVSNNMPKHPKRPEGMAREVYALLCVDRCDVPPMMPADTSLGYKNKKAKLGMRKVRPWKRVGFTNPAREDNAVFHHWRRAADEGKEYPFAKFNKKVDIPEYTYEEYTKYLRSDSWTKEQTDHLFDLCKRFDRRFIIVHDRFDRDMFDRIPDMEDLKERFYAVCNTLEKVRYTGSTPFQETKVFDAEHERNRKEQLNMLYNRTPEQVEEEANLMQELKKIELRKKEREKKAQDLQKLIGTEAPAESRKQEKRPGPKKRIANFNRSRNDANASAILADEIVGIKFPENKNSGANTRSARMKLPANVGQKKIKSIEAKLKEMNLSTNPIPTEEVCSLYNELRSEIVVLNEIKSALATCMYEVESSKHQYDAHKPDESTEIPEWLLKHDDETD